MSMRRLIRDSGAASAAEFAMVLPLLILLLFGIIDGGRWLWTLNRAEKATQMGVRMAAVTDFVAPQVGNSYVGVGGLTQGDPIPAGAFATVTCSRSGTNASCTPASGTANTAAFDQVVERMRAFMPEIEGGNVQIIYSGSGVGYAGNPNGPDVAPIITVRLTGLQFTPIVTLAMQTFNLPDFRSSLTLEDGAGAQSN